MRIVCAMSGGVDSSVAAALLHEAGHEVIGVHMKLHDAAGSDAGHCCGLDDALDARRVADRLGIPFYVMDLRTAFQESVMNDLVAQYAAGLTPNPCVQCNGVLKFHVLLRRALALGAEAIATGHYARTEEGRLFAAADKDKDQSYFLHPVRAEALRMSRFPLGGMTKPEVREHARRFGLITAEKPESMEVCFIPDDDHARFVREALPELEGAGDIVDESGRVLGRHDGYFRYTLGQRRGLGLSGGPWFVVNINAARRQVVVGGEDRLLAHDIEVRGANWLQPAEALRGRVLHARARHRGALAACAITESAGSPGHAHVRLAAPLRAVTPGQSLVVYDGDEVVFGGLVRRVGTSAMMGAAL
jgi:tRNA-uridine 2-sulfurtransferase